MYTPRWTQMLSYFFVASSIANLHSLCAPIRRQESDLAPPDRVGLTSKEWSLSAQFARRSPSGRKKADKAHNAQAGPSTHHGASSSHGHTAVIHAGDLKDKSRYRKTAKEHANEEHLSADWVHQQADHLLEAQIVSSTINHYMNNKAGKITDACKEALRKPMNEKTNLYPLSAALNQEKNRITAQFLKHTGHKDRISDIDEMSPDLAKYFVVNRRNLMRTAKELDIAIESEDCRGSFGGTNLVKGGIIELQAKRMVDHAFESQRRQNHNSKGK